MKTAWYVDDDQEMIEAISLMMKLLDFETIPFFNAPAASRQFQTGERPDLLLLDINMPQISGIDLLEFVRKKEKINDLPILMLSSEHTDVQVDEALAKGADGYALKPVTLDELEKAINMAIAKRRKQFL